MLHRHFSFLAASAFALTMGSAHAQVGAPAHQHAAPASPKAAPASPKAAPAAASATALYQSAFANYQSYREPEVLSWQALNKLVGDGGTEGHGTAPAPAPGPARADGKPATVAPDKMPDHGAMHKH